MNNSTLGRIFLVYFIAATAFIAFNYNTFVSTINAGSIPKALLFYMLANIDYLIIIIAVFYFGRGVNFLKKTLASILLIWAIDIISFPRLSPAGMTTDSAFMASSDAILAKAAVTGGIPYNTFWWGYYLVLPLLIITIAAWTLGVVELGRLIKR